MQTMTDNLDDGVADYPLGAAKRALVSYFFYAGTLPGGLQELQEDAGAAAAKQTPAAFHYPRADSASAAQPMLLGRISGLPSLLSRGTRRQFCALHGK
jgi:hypothetical protein